MKQEEREELSRILSETEMNGHLTKDEMEYLMQNTFPVRYEGGEHVHSPAERCEGVILVRSGRLRIYLLSDEGRDVTLYRIRKDDICILSASCVLDAISFDVFIDAEVPTSVFRISSPAFRRLAGENVYVRCFGYHLATERFSDVMWAMQQILFRGVDRRLAAFLLDEMQHNGSPEISLRQEQIASYIGSSREVVSRMLKYFSSEGIARSGRGKIVILNEKKLRELAEE